MNSEPGNIPINTDDSLAEKYLSLAEKYQRLLLQSEELKVEVQFVVRHLKMMDPADKNLRAVLVARLEKRLQDSPPPTPIAW